MIFSYYFLDEQSQPQGPITADRFTEFGVQPNTLVWREGMRSWMAAISLPELQPIFRGDNFNGQSAGYNSTNNGYNTGYQQAAPNYNVPPLPPRPIDHLIVTAISTVLCFFTFILLPLPIMGIIKSINAERKYRIGLYAEATVEAQKAKKWSMSGLLGCLILLLIYLALLLIILIYPLKHLTISPFV